MIDDIIPKFPKEQWNYLRHAAQHWRLPYWDWASKKPVFDTSPVEYDYDVPHLVRLESVNIRTPEGQKWVKNPLYVFRMPGNFPMSKAGVDHICIGLDEGGNKKYVEVGKYFLDRQRLIVSDSKLQSNKQISANQ